MSFNVGDTYPASVKVRDASGVLTDPDTLVLKVRDGNATIVTYAWPGAEIIDHDGDGEFHADVPLTAAGMWVMQWDAGALPEVDGVQVWVSPAPTVGVTFATLDELALRLGKSSATELTDAQVAQGQMLLELVTGMIVDEVDRDDGWAATLSPIPRAVRAVCLEAVARVMQNPAGVRSESEQLGAYQHSSSYTDDAHGPMLTDRESTLCRRSILGQLSGSAALQSLGTCVADSRPNVIDGWVGDVNPDIYEDIT